MARVKVCYKNEGPGYEATSTSTITFGTGNISLTTQDNLAYTNGARVRITDQSDITKYMEGVVTAYDIVTGDITIAVDKNTGTGDNSDWNLNLSGDTGATGPTGPQGPVGMTWEGTYAGGTTYQVDDVVSYNGSSYICILESTGNLPTDGTYWSVLAAKGTDGAGDITGPATNTADYIPQWDGANSKTLKDGLPITTWLKLDQTTPQTVQGFPVFDEGIQFGTTPTAGAFSTGKIYYDEAWRTFTANVSGDVELQIGQEDLRLVYNNTGSTILNGQAVYTTGVYNAGTNDVATIGLAKADSSTTAFVLGLATQDILDGTYGLITVRGHINNINTDSFTAGDVLWLSVDTAGAITNTQPMSPNLKIRIGRVITKAVSGRINVRLNNLSRVEDLSDYEGTAVDGDMLVREGNAWVPKSGAVSAGASVNVYLDNDATVDNYLSLLRTPDNVTATQTDSVLVNTGTVGGTLLIRGFLYNQTENRTKWDGGVWKFNTYCYCSTGTGTNEIIVGVHNVQDFGGTATITGTGTSRTCTVSGYTGTPFVAGDANADMTLAGYVQTPLGTFQITAYSSANVVTIATPTGYSNEAGVDFTVHKYKFQSSTGDIQQTGTPILYEHSIAQTDITLKDLTDTIAFRYYGRTNSSANRTLYLTYNGATSYSYVETPLTQRHDDLAGLNLTGGNYQHLTAAQKTIATQAASGSQDGYLSSANWATFNSKQDALSKASSSEINTGTDNDKYITSDALAGATIGKRLIQVKIFDDATAVTTGDGKLVLCIPLELNGMNLVQAEAYCSTVSSSGTPTVQIRNVTDSADMLSTRITIDATEYTSYTAATRSVVDGTHDDVATGDLIAIDVDVSGTGTRGLGIILSFQIP